jgi:2-polyprenyl-6-methoxyphenol hydroxylase-like FAD-dependent oxidoreductase
MVEVPVLIVGGGPVGLTASILLSQQGVRSLLVDRRPRTSIHPKSRGINARTMEILLAAFGLTRRASDCRSLSWSLHTARELGRS